MAAVNAASAAVFASSVQPQRAALLDLRARVLNDGGQ